VAGSIACRCGSAVFTVHTNALEGVGLAICAEGHPSFLLDSRDVWATVIQSGRPRKLRCRCKNSTFQVSVGYEFRDGSPTVRAAHVRARCAACGAERSVFDVDIDYEPTVDLLERPLDPVDDPWLKAKWVELSGLWMRTDLECLLRFVGTLSHARIVFASPQQGPRELSAEDASHALRGSNSFDFAFTNVPVTLPEQLHDAWKNLPLVHVGTPTSIRYSTGPGELHYVSYALERIEGGVVTRQPAPFLGFATRIRSWLESEFVSDRGKNTVDNRHEYQRLKGGW